MESMARKLGEEFGQRVFEQRKAELEKLFEDKYRTLLERGRLKVKELSGKMIWRRAEPS